MDILWKIIFLRTCETYLLYIKMKQPKFIRKIKQRVNDILSVWSVAGFFSIYEIVIVPHYGSKKTLTERQLRKQRAITAVLQKKYAYLIGKYSVNYIKSPPPYIIRERMDLFGHFGGRENKPCHPLSVYVINLCFVMLELTQSI